MKPILKKLNVILNDKQKNRMKLLVVMMVIGALLETVSISLVLPIATVLTNPESVKGEGIVGGIYRLLGCISNAGRTFAGFCRKEYFFICAD